MKEQHDYIEKQLSLLTSEIKEKIRQMREEVEVKVCLAGNKTVLIMIKTLTCNFLHDTSNSIGRLRVS